MSQLKQVTISFSYQAFIQPQYNKTYFLVVEIRPEGGLAIQIKNIHFTKYHLQQGPEDEGVFRHLKLSISTQNKRIHKQNKEEHQNIKNVNQLLQQHSDQNEILILISTPQHSQTCKSRYKADEKLHCPLNGNCYYHVFPSTLTIFLSQYKQIQSYVVISMEFVIGICILEL